MTKIRRRRCKICRELFDPDPRLKSRQYACFKTSCQRTRQFQNVEDWYIRNPQVLAYRQEQTKAWFKDHPSYSRKRRSTDPGLKALNRLKTSRRMKILRARKLFDKTKSIITQGLWNHGDKFFLNSKSELIVRLTKQSRLKTLYRACQNLDHPLVKTNVRGAFYELSENFKE